MGRTVEYAQGQLDALDIQVQVLEREDEGAEPGTILTQDPAPGESVALGTTLTLTVAIAPTYSATGTFSLRAVLARTWTDSRDDCRGDGGYRDIHSTTQVTARNENGIVIGATQLGTGTHDGTWCTYEFTVDGLPRTAFYSFEVGSRGELTYSFAELQQRNWRVAFSLGD